MKKALVIFLAVLFVCPVVLSAKGPESKELNVISFNIRLGSANDGTNSWEFRYPSSAMMIMDQKPDIFGLQEALPFQKKYLDEVCESYKGVGVPRDDGKKEGEIMAIFYNTKTVKLLKWGTFWLSETPDKPSKGWDAACFRTATWALMKHKATGKKFFYVNTHLDHIGWEARRKGLSLIMDKIAAMNPENLPMVLTGDFNMTSDRPEFNELKARMQDAREAAVATDHLATYNGWGKSSSIIDFIWFSGFSSCTQYQTVTKKYFDRKYISDHFPVKATLVF